MHIRDTGLAHCVWHCVMQNSILKFEERIPSLYCNHFHFRHFWTLTDTCKKDHVYQKILMSFLSSKTKLKLFPPTAIKQQITSETWRLWLIKGLSGYRWQLLTTWDPWSICQVQTRCLLWWLRLVSAWFWRSHITFFWVLITHPAIKLNHWHSLD